MTRAFCVGLTGGVGCGKSTVAECFARQGVTVVDTDLIARELTARHGQALAAIVAEFGETCLAADGALDRPAMRARIFSDPGARLRLERILHPLIRQEAARRLAGLTACYALLVVPLLAEHMAAYRGLIDRIAVVDCDVPQQVQRIISRPGMTKTQARAILASQCDRTTRLALADDVIDNRGDLSALESQALALHARYLRLAGCKARGGATTRCAR
ncbi:MAG TPA: dephospho-CoA kinase [Thiobacillaceae bacterium]|nr:dephospho-CoA kinase [Thiobacillaceae bacterium]HNU64697.1 dephospho-CoA kinase [Thiobacillaceae bacterium]